MSENNYVADHTFEWIKNPNKCLHISDDLQELTINPIIPKGTSTKSSKI